MRLVIDKDIPEVQLLQESYEKKNPRYKVRAVNEHDKFIYAKDLKRIVEAKIAVYDATFDPAFDDCQLELVEVTEGSERVLWSSDSKVLVQESAWMEADEADNAKPIDPQKQGQDAGKQGAKDQPQDGNGQPQDANGEKKDDNQDKGKKGFLNKLKEVIGKAVNFIGTLKKNFSTKILNKWRDAGYFTKDGQITGLGWKVMNGKAKNTVSGDDDDKSYDITQVATIVFSNIDNTLKPKGFTIKERDGIVKNDKDPITFRVDVADKDGNESTLELDQKGNIINGQGNTDQGSQEKNGAEGDSEEGADDENDTAAAGKDSDLEPRVDKIETALKKQNILTESTMNWNFNDQQMTNKAGIERAAIKRFFNDVNDPSVKEIVFVSESGEKKVYSTATGSQSYSEFKKDFREATSRAVGKVGEYKLTVESGYKSNLSGFKFSSFGFEDDFDSDSKTIVYRESTKKLVTPDDDGKETSTPKTVVESEIKLPEVPNNTETCGLTLELGEVDPVKQVQALLASMNKYNGHEKEKPENYDGTIDAGVSTYPDVPEFETPKKQEPLDMPEQKPQKVETPEVVKEAEGDDEPDPFADDTGGDAGGGDAGADAGGGEADPFAGGGDDAGGGDAGGDAGGAAAGGDVGGDAGGADAGGDAGGDPFGGDADAGGDAGAEGGDEAAGEPAAPDAVNTDAQGNEKSQYNINVTRPFNAEDDFSLNEEEQKEFFGKIDQLVKIPDMDNYSLYLYQITPENMNLDDVHYIEALYQLSVKLGLLEDIYADSNLLEKYNSYKYSVVKDGENTEEDELKVQEQSNPIWGNNKVLSEAKETDKKEGVSKVQDDNEEKADWLKKANDDRLGPKEQKLDVDKNGAPKPVIIDTTKEGWDSLNGKEHGKLVDSTVEGDFHGLGWLVTFKAMQFGSPRYMTMYIKRNGDEKAEKQCEEYLKKLSYSDIEIVKLEEIDPYEYMYRQSCSGMKTPEEIQQAAVVNKDIPYFESSEPDSIPKDIKRDVKKVITKLNAEIRNTKQFNFMNETGVFKPQIDPHEFIMGYRTAQFNETLSETTYKFVFKKNDSTFSRMFYSNLKEKLFKYLGIFAQKFGLECGCESTPKAIVIDFIRSDIGNPGYDLEGMVDTEEPEETPVETDNKEEASVAPTLDQALEMAKDM